jgi:type I site-specific restriction endonuclease
MNVPLDFESADNFTNFALETSGPVQTILANQSHRRKEEILKAITEAGKKYADNNTGKVKFDNEAILIVGKKLSEQSHNTKDYVLDKHNGDKIAMM